MRFEAGDGAVEVTLSGGVARVLLDRPAKLNALTPQMFAGIAQALEYLAGQADLRCVVLSGAGRSFCAGIDLASLAGGIDPLGPRTHGLANQVQHVAVGWRELPVPVVAALHGHVFGAGLQIALGADVRIAAPDVRLSVMETRHGLVPDMGGFVLARGLIRADHWRDLVYTAREFSGDEGMELGLVTRVADDPLDAALAWAQRIADQDPAAISAAKRLANAMNDSGAAELLQAEADEQQTLLSAARTG